MAEDRAGPGKRVAAGAPTKSARPRISRRRAATERLIWPVGEKNKERLDVTTGQSDFLYAAAGFAENASAPVRIQAATQGSGGRSFSRIMADGSVVPHQIPHQVRSVAQPPRTTPNRQGFMISGPGPVRDIIPRFVRLMVGKSLQQPFSLRKLSGWRGRLVHEIKAGASIEEAPWAISTIWRSAMGQNYRPKRVRVKSRQPLPAGGVHARAPGGASSACFHGASRGHP